MRRAWPWLVLLLAMAGGCAQAPEECEAMCDQALECVEGCLDEWGLAWGDALGYADPDDHGNWCRTFVWEQTELAADRVGPVEGRAWVAGTCEDQRAALADGDCETYGGSWSVWEE